MAYIGNPPAESFTNTVKDSFSGNGSTTAFTMSQPSVTNDVRVVVENVVQDPTVAYSCAGTTLTFTSAPVAGTNNIYVVHLGPAVMTAQPPAEISSATAFLDTVTLRSILGLNGANYGTAGQVLQSAGSSSPVVWGSIPAGVTTLNGLTDVTVSTADPAIDTNPTSGVGQLWLNETTGELYVCTDATTNFNIWKNVGDGTGTIGSAADAGAFITATGGTVTTDGDYKVHTFTTSGTLQITNTSGTLLQGTYVLAAGGAAGGLTTVSDYMSGGGGGAGGCFYGSFRPIAATGYSVIIGAGGSVGTYPNPNNGSRSSALSFLALGGGHGASAATSGSDADSGGSGGGGAAAGEQESGSRALAYGTTGQGNRGGSGNWTAYAKTAGGGGGGVLGVGQNGTGSTGGDGGAGLVSSISGSSVTYARGGGGGGSVTSGAPVNTAGAANTGNGGSGCPQNRNANFAGGSGVFIFRYQFQ